MEPTISDGDRVHVDLWTLRGRPPRSGEIVVFSGPDGNALVKRVAGEPHGVVGGYPPSSMPADSVLEPTFILLGDNRDESRDSREFGAIPRHFISGRVAWRYWPPSRCGTIE